MMDIQYLGNQELLKLQKTAFLASNTIPIEMVLKCYDWATGKHDGCVRSGLCAPGKCPQNLSSLAIQDKLRLHGLQLGMKIKYIRDADKYLNLVCGVLNKK